MRRPEWVVGIDFGTTEGGMPDFGKVPSMIAFYDDKLHWGFGVLSVASTSHPSSYTLVKLFKVMFDSDNESAAEEARKAVRLYLEQLYKHLEKIIPEQKGGPRREDWHKVKFVFGYPTTWDGHTQKIFSDLAKEAGFPPFMEQTDLTSLDEAEASFVQYLYSNNNKKTMPKVGSNILVADIGGGTTDVSIFKLSSLKGLDDELTLLVKFKGKYAGSTNIDDQVRLQLEPKVRARFEQELGSQSPPVDVERLDALVNAALLHLDYNQYYLSQKHHYASKAVEGKLRKQSEFVLRIAHPSMADEVCSLRIDKHEYFKGPFDEQTKEVWKHCETQMEALKADQTVDYVVLAGGLGASPYVVPKLKSLFEKHVKSKNATVVRMGDPQLAVSRGLVRNEQRIVQGSLGWVYPAEASYGIRRLGTKTVTEWFLRKGKKVKIPEICEVKFDVKMNEKDPLRFQLVKSTKETVWPLEPNDSAISIYDISEEMKAYLPEPGEMPPKNMFSKEAKLTFKICLIRNAVELTLSWDEMKAGRVSPVYVIEKWYENAKEKRSFKPTPSRWWIWVARTAKVGFAAFNGALFSAAVHQNATDGQGGGGEEAPPDDDVVEDVVEDVAVDDVDVDADFDAGVDVV